MCEAISNGYALLLPCAHWKINHSEYQSAALNPEAGAFGIGRVERVRKTLLFSHSWHLHRVTFICLLPKESKISLSHYLHSAASTTSLKRCLSQDHFLAVFCGFLYKFQLSESFESSQLTMSPQSLSAREYRTPLTEPLYVCRNTVITWICGWHRKRHDEWTCGG